MMKKIYSVFLLIIININRVFDHAYRIIFGLPTLSRSQITADIYLGGQYGVRALNKLMLYSVTGIVNMRTTAVPKEVAERGFHTLHLPTPDLHAPKLSDLQKGIIFIQKEIDRGGKVYVHCRWGEGRGPTMVIAYLMSTGLTYEDAYNQVKTVRTFINLSASQVARLHELEKILNKKFS